MHRRILTHRWLLAPALHLLATVCALSQTPESKPKVKHFAYSGTDKLLDCIGRVYGTRKRCLTPFPPRSQYETLQRR
jgi:hypothetical protein